MAKDDQDTGTHDIVTAINKSKNYDYTINERGKRRRLRIKEAGLSEIKVVAHKDDSKKVREYAEKLYKKRGISYEAD